MINHLHMDIVQVCKQHLQGVEIMSTLPVYFVSHGGGPWPWIKDQFGTGTTFDALEASLKSIAEEIGGSAKAILMVTGHWEAPGFSVSNAEHPGMLYDYSGFPPETYEIQYPAPGNPALASRARQLLLDGGFESQLDSERGYDHGTFTVMYPMFPDADMPVVQVSVRLDLDPLAHLQAGKALAPLRDEGVVIIGSGLSFHNLGLRGPEAKAPSVAFDTWLTNTLTGQTSKERWKLLTEWKQAPSARLAHPREDHLLPLMVVTGAAEDDSAECIYHEDDFFGHWSVSSYRFGRFADPNKSG